MGPSARRRETLSRARALLDRVLRGGGKLASEYPLVFEERFPGRIVALEEAGDVRSACGFLVRNLIVPGARVRAGFIGSVATDPDWRGQGFASQVLSEAERCLMREGCTVAVLWADDPAFYLARGWRPFGSEADFLVPFELAPRLPERRDLRRAAPDDRGAIHRIYCAHPERVERSADESAALLACPDMETLVATHERDVCAYACLGRGVDFARTVHEWGGAPGDVLALVREHLRREDERGSREGVFLVAPTTAVELRRQLRALGCPESRGVLGLAKLLDLEAAGELLERFTDSAVHAVLESSAAGGTRLLLRGPGGQRAVTADELLALLFPPGEDRSVLDAVAGPIGHTLGGLPLQPFVWGLDSI